MTVQQSMAQRLILQIFGDVQGIGFRYGARQKARELRLAGFVRNEPDGSVYIEAEGEHGKLEEFLRWCREDAPGRGDEVEQEFSDKIKGFGEFEIR